MEDTKASSSHPSNSPYPPTTGYSSDPPLGYPQVNYQGYPPTGAPAGYPPMAYPGQPPMANYNPAYPMLTDMASQQTAPGYAPLANATQQQQPINNKPVVVIDSKYCAPAIVDLVISRKMSLKEGTFGVTDLQDNILFKVKGKMFSLHDKRVLLDAQDQPIVSFQQKLLTAHRRWNAFRGESSDPKDLMFTVKKSSIIQLFGTGLEVFLASNTSKDNPDFKIKGSYSESSCTIYAGDSTTVICQMRRQHNNIQSLMFGRDKFGVTIYPKVDVAFVVALVVILEEINQDRNGED